MQQNVIIDKSLLKMLVSKVYTTFAFAIYLNIKVYEYPYSTTRTYRLS